MLKIFYNLAAPIQPPTTTLEQKQYNMPGYKYDT